MRGMRDADLSLALAGLLLRDEGVVMTKAESAYLGRVASLGCILCQRLGYGETPAEIHHVREGQGMAQRAENWLAVPLCPEHHRGKTGIHGNRMALKQIKADEVDLLAWTIEALNG